MYQLSEVSTEECGQLLNVNFSFKSQDKRLQPKKVTVALSPDMNMFEVGMHLNKTAAIILGHHEQAEKICSSR